MAIPNLSRRTAVRGFLLSTTAGLVGFVVARRSDAAKPRAATTAANNYGAPAAAPEQPLASLDEIPLDGGLILEDRRVVLTRTPDGGVRAFSATCTHQGCVVESISGGTINCPCHGSRFDLRTGEPVAGPARSPLRDVPVVVRGTDVVRS